MKSLLKKHKFKIYVLLLFLVFLEIISYQVLRKDYTLDMARNFLKDDTNPIAQPRLNGLPYLNYTCTPGFIGSQMQVGHNEAGFRGKLIPLEKKEKEFRILFLGGSTTYSYFIRNAERTLPEQVKTLLSNSEVWVRMMRDSGVTLEVINAGLPSGTTAELLTHYLFKYRYYNPDLVVIHTGGNDSYAYYLGSHYQPDYSHFRNSFPRLVGIPECFKPLLSSRFLSLLIIRTFYKNLLTQELYEHEEEWPVPNWFTQDDFMRNQVHNAFYRNVETLINVARSDGSEVILMPFVYNDKWPGLAKVYLDGIDYNVSLLKMLSDSLAVSYCELSADMIPLHDWVDDCHLTEQGISVKAELVSKEVEGLILNTKLNLTNRHVYE